MNELNKTRESVKEGEEIVSQTLKILGNVHENSIIEASTLHVEGTTLEDSTQFSRFATINKHQGKLRCHEAQINVLEGGEVHATTLKIDSAFSGDIYAQDVIINNAHSDLKVFASNSITINNILGINNTLTINYKDIPILDSKLDLIEDDLNTLNSQLKEALKHNLSEIQNIKQKILNLTSEKNSILNSYKRAKIIITNGLRANNTIKFFVHDKQLSFSSQDENHSTFKLLIDANTITLFPTQEQIFI